MNKEILEQLKEDAVTITNLESGLMYPDVITGSNTPKSTVEIARLYGQRIVMNTEKLLESIGK
ncbi:MULTISPECIES: hypothetical protein [Enterococcus]|uniref:hypothetical protein n=1 Tax=Enterococcus TaxID=1350 RepID=UPI0024933570|nr:hypothetical protein [Enterococcus dispar]